MKNRQIEDIHESLASVFSSLFVDLENEPQLSPDCPLDVSSPDDIRIDNATSLDDTLRQHYLKAEDNVSSTPEIRLEGDAESIAKSNGQASSTLHASSAGRLIPAHPGHASALLRLLFIHATLHPDSNSPHTASLLVMLYSVMNQEVELSDLSHVEADTFWLFEALCATISEIEDEEGGTVWMKKISARLASIDGVLFERLVSEWNFEICSLVHVIL